MAARAMWKADLLVGETKLPVKLYAAVRDTKVHFRLLHGADLAPVRQQMVDLESGQVAPAADIQKAVEVDRGIYVVLTEVEQNALKPKPSRDIGIEQFVAAASLDERWFDRPYYLGPDGDEQGYFALAEVLEKRDAVGIARWVLRGKRYVGALDARGGYLVLETLRHAQELVELDSVRPAAGRAADRREIALAEQLIATLEDRFDPDEFRDEYQEQLRALLEAKASGKVVRFPKAAPRKDAGSLVASLEASLKAGRKRAGRGG